MVNAVNTLDPQGLTPETDAGLYIDETGARWVKPELARRLEQERNAALRREAALKDLVVELERRYDFDPIESGR